MPVVSSTGVNGVQFRVVGDEKQMIPWLYVGLAFAIVANAAVLVVEIQAHTYMFAGNLVAIIVCVLGLWVLRHREFFRGE
jgi:hypothetical protein